MIGWLIRILFFIAGSITSLFITRDALNFSIFQMVIAVLIFTVLVIAIAFWPMFYSWYKQKMKKTK